MSRTKCSFCLLGSLIFLWFRRVYGGSCKTSSLRRLPRRLSCCVAWQAWHFVTFQPVLYRVERDKIGGCLARNARFASPTCLVSSLWFSCGFAVAMGEAAKPLFSKVATKVVMLFCVAGVALGAIPTCFIQC